MSWRSVACPCKRLGPSPWCAIPTARSSRLWSADYFFDRRGSDQSPERQRAGFVSTKCRGRRLLLPLPVVEGVERALYVEGAQHVDYFRSRHQYRPVSLHRSEEHTSELQSPCNLVCRL